MPRIFRVQANDPLLSGLAGGAASASTAMRFRSQKLAEERQQQALDLRNKQLDQQIDLARQAQAIKDKEAAATNEIFQGDIGAIQGRLAPPGSLPPGMEGPLPEGANRIDEGRMEFLQRLENDKRLSSNLSPRAQERLYERRLEEENRFAIQDAFEAEAQELADAVGDGLFEGAEGTEQELASLLQEEMEAGRKPGKVSESIRKLRKQHQEEQIVQQEWADAEQAATRILESVTDPDIRRDVQRLIIENQAPSARKSRRPDLFLSKVRRAALDDRSAQGEAFRGTQFDTISEEERAREFQEKLERGKALFQPGSQTLQNAQERKRLEREGKGLVGSSVQRDDEGRLLRDVAPGQPQEGLSFSDRVRDSVAREERGVAPDTRVYGDLPAVKRRGLDRRLQELLSGKAKESGAGAFGIDTPRPVRPTRESLAALFEEFGVDPQSLPPEVRRKIVRGAAFGGKDE